MRQRSNNKGKGVSVLQKARELVVGLPEAVDRLEHFEGVSEVVKGVCPVVEAHFTHKGVDPLG